MAQKAGYQGIKKLTPPIDITSEGTLFIEEGYYQKTELSEPVEGQSTVEGALGALSDADKATRQLIEDTVGWTGKNRITLPYKNIASFPYTNNGVKYECDDDGVITVTKIETETNLSSCVLFARNTPNNLIIEPGDYIGNGSPSSDAVVRFFCTRNGEAYVYGNSEAGSDVPFTVLEGDVVGVMIIVSLVYNPQGVKVKPMIRRAGITDATFEPYHASVEESKVDNSVIAPVENGTTVQKSGGYAVGSHAIRNGAFITWKNAKAQGETIADSDYTSEDVASVSVTNFPISLNTNFDLNNIKTTGIYFISSSSPSNAPTGAGSGMLLVKNAPSGGVFQMMISDTAIYTRKYGGSPLAWGSWYKYDGTIIS